MRSTMLFFFELFLFVLVMLTLGLGEFVSKGLALTLWLVVSGFSLVGYVLARYAVRDLLNGAPTAPPLAPPGEEVHAESVPSSEPTPPETPPASAHADLPIPEGSAAAPTALDARWARTLLYNWRRSNVLLLAGAIAVGGWYWLAG